MACAMIQQYIYLFQRLLWIMVLDPHQWIFALNHKRLTFRKGVKIHLGRTETDLCPVAALIDYINIRGNHHGPLFCFKTNKHCNQASFVTKLREIHPVLSQRIIVDIALGLGLQQQLPKWVFLITLFRCWADGRVLHIS